MMVADPLLPAAPYLTGAHAGEVVGPAVEAGGGVLESLEPRQVLYRPSRELVVSYAAVVSWQSGPPVNETLLAATTPSGEPPGTMPIEAGGLRVGVWRYPFDPYLIGLADAVTNGPVSRLLGVAAADLTLTVCSYRPCRRAVVYARWPTGDAYIKIVPPDEARRLIDAHAALLASGLPVPEIIDTDEQHGVVVMRALSGTPLRTRLLEGHGAVPDGRAIFDVVQGFAAINPVGAWLADGEQVSLIDAAPRHAAMLAKVLPPLTGRLDALLAGLHEPGVATETRVVHGDLHDGQLQVDDRGRIVGVLDVDRVGLGEPLDDLARFVGHAIALGELTPAARAHIDGFTSRLRHHLDGLVDRREFDRRVAAALIGLATGPFRSQMPFWHERVGDVLRLAEGFMPDENTLSEPS
jgi:hypothetical protein